MSGEATENAPRRTVRTVEAGRLLWWREEADEDYWWRHFEPSIEGTHRAAARGEIGSAGELLARHLPRTGRILEAGCGTGWLVAGLGARGFDIEGVEYSERLVTEVARRYPALSVRHGDARRLDVPDGHYRAYVSLGVIEHFREGPEAFLREACRVVEPGGSLLVSVPHFNALRRFRARLGAYRGEVGELDFYQYGFSKRDFASLLRRFELELVGFGGYGTARCFQEELPRAYTRMLRTPLLWRLPRALGHLDRTLLASHMILAIARRRARA